MTFSLGQTVGDYRIVDVIGSGGMGTVYKVQHVISERIEAMKVILPSLIGSPELAERFMREIKVHARLNHPNIASLHNALRVDESLLMVMEYVEGSTLHARLLESKLDPALSTNIVLQVLSALEYAHARSVIHRDIKPANIIITRDGAAKLMDFGIARAADQNDHLTRTGAAVGSLYYMSPEQIQGLSIDHRSDLYSLGITFYEMLTGQKPITGDTSWAIMNGHMTHIPSPPASVNPNLSPALSLAVLKALEKRPENRYQSASEFAHILQSIPTASSGVSDAATIVIPRLPSPSEAKVPAATPPEGFSSNVRFEPAELERVKSALAAYVGPMARILVDRAARKSSSLQQLYELLAAEVPEGQERKKFLAGRRR